MPNRDKVLRTKNRFRDAGCWQILGGSLYRKVNIQSAPPQQLIKLIQIVRRIC